jgi:hypothetical protein
LRQLDVRLQVAEGTDLPLLDMINEAFNGLAYGFNIDEILS